MKTKLLSILIASASVLFAKELTFSEALRKAKTGDSDAQWQLARMYRNGTNGVSHSYEEAIKWYTKAADAGHPRALCGLASMYENGLGVDKSTTEAMNLYLRSGEKGYAHAYSCIGFMYEDGVGVAKSKEKAFSYYLKAARMGGVSGQCNAGRCYAHGIGCKQSGQESIKWLLKAAEQNSTEAYYRLGLYYELGIGVEMSETTAIKYFKRGAELGSEECKKKISELTAPGKAEYDEYINLVTTRPHDSIIRSNERENRLLRASAQKGYERAQFIVATGLLSEASRSNDDKKYAEAIMWYRKSAAQGNSQSMKQLSCLYGLGNGCKQSFAEALYWAEKGSKVGDASCKVLLANMYSNGLGCPKDEVKAFELIRDAAKENFPDAWYLLGVRYMTGQGTPVSLELGIHWLKKAADNGHEEADKILMELNGEKYEIPTSMSLGCRIRFNDAQTRKKLRITSVYPCSDPEGSHLVYYATELPKVEGIECLSWAIVMGGRVISLTEKYTVQYRGNKNAAIQKAMNVFDFFIDLQQSVVGSGLPFEVESSPSMRKAKKILPVGSAVRDRIKKAVEISMRENPEEEIYLTLRNHSRTIDKKTTLKIGKNSVVLQYVRSLLAK